MNYIMIFNNTAGYKIEDLHEVVKATPNLKKWWHYLPNAYIIVADNTTVANITAHLRKYAPELILLVAKIDLNDTGGLLPKDAWEWINQQNSTAVKLQPSSLSGNYDRKYNDLLRSLLNPPKPTPGPKPPVLKIR